MQPQPKPRSERSNFMLTNTEVARICHEANRAYCLALGDTSQPVWENAPEWQRESSLSGVQGYANGMTAEQHHESWMDDKIAAGWVYGEVKDPEAKTHPCCVPYYKLPEDQKLKDKLFGAICEVFRG